MGTAQGDSRGLFEGLHPLISLASQFLSDAFGIHAHHAGKEGSEYERLSRLGCFLYSFRDIAPEKIIPFLERWSMDQASDRMDTFLCQFPNQLWQSKAETPDYKKGLWTKETVLPDHIL